MGVIDRTDEFRQLIRELHSKGAVPGFEGLDGPAGNQANSELNVWSAQIGGEIHQASLKVAELRKLAKAKGIFNDKTSEIQELTSSVKQDIKLLDQKIEALKAKATGSGPNKSHQTHASNMVTALKTRLMEVTKDFKDALEHRSKTMEFQNDRRKMFSASSSGPSNPFQSRQGPVPTGNAADLEGGGSGGGGGGQAQATMYYSSRTQAVESVQRTIGELAQMFQNMAVMVTAQEEMIQRIDQDVNETSENVKAGQASLLAFYQKISGNRMLIIKVFLILIFFVIFFVVFLA
eukprot:TRINITY_DN7896_c0_g1_i2.p1 TRINITY_DN7896_c0_g1~~TRINITY_DN7896_c0_g1_i2.p1  ORF type:complete len:291 (-),score=69.69 TRINITY_DN7896_c0_g1_i2:124-996(-)